MVDIIAEHRPTKIKAAKPTGINLTIMAGTIPPSGTDSKIPKLNTPVKVTIRYNGINTKKAKDIIFFASLGFLVAEILCQILACIIQEQPKVIINTRLFEML